MANELDSALLDLLDQGGLGVLVTLKRDGRPQLSDITYHYEPATRLVRISVTEDRAKTRNARRDPRVSLHVRAPSGWGYAVAEGSAQLAPATTDPDDATADALVSLYRDARGEEHPDWQEYREAMVAEKRLVLSFVVEHVYGMA